MRHRGVRIMVVDDSLVVRNILATGLKREGYQVECFEDGIEALRALQEPTRQGLPDLIVLDVMLPRLDGYEIARLLKSRPELRQVPIVMLSRRDGVIDRVKGHLSGAQAYVIKPFRMSEVARVVRDLLKTGVDGVNSHVR